MKKFNSVRDSRLNPVKLMTVFLVLSLFLCVSVVVLRDPLSDRLWATDQARNLYSMFHKAMIGEDDGVEMEKDKLLGGLLPSGMDENSCLSRYELSLYWRGEARRPSPHLISKLRSYEARHRRCGPHTQSYNGTVQHLQSNSTDRSLDCKYIVWISMEGLGNKMLSLASAFLYALLTDRVLLVDRGADIPDLFCEPFPEASWFLPLEFPINHHFSTFNQQSNYSYGNQLRADSIASAPYMYLFLAHDCDDQDKLFFCDQHQTYLHDIPWLMMKTDQYIAPMFFLMPSFQEELHTLFPEKETVFHLLGRYLFHPTNSVWGLITRFHQAYLSKADVIAGIQVRLFSWNAPFSVDQILSCTKRENILPQISQRRSIDKATTTAAGANVAVVMVSLRSSYFERVRELYWENATETGEVVGVFQPSHEEYQQTGKPNHDRKALAEIYLLSLTDKGKLLTTTFSTFGYVAQALGGVKPWVLYTPRNKKVVDPPCGRSMSLEPCYHRPPHLDCKTRRQMDMGGVVAHVRRCEGFSQGIKLF